MLVPVDPAKMKAMLLWFLAHTYSIQMVDFCHKSLTQTDPYIPTNRSHQGLWDDRELK